MSFPGFSKKKLENLAILGQLSCDNIWLELQSGCSLDRGKLFRKFNPASPTATVSPLSGLGAAATSLS